jgi:hypothetical protein
MDVHVNEHPYKACTMLYTQRIGFRISGFILEMSIMHCIIDISKTTRKFKKRHQKTEKKAFILT